MGGEPAITQRGGSREVDATSCRLGRALRGFVSGVMRYIRSFDMPLWSQIQVSLTLEVPHVARKMRLSPAKVKQSGIRTKGCNHSRGIHLIDCVGCFWFSESDRDTAGLKFENAGDRWGIAGEEGYTPKWREGI